MKFVSNHMRLEQYYPSLPESIKAEKKKKKHLNKMKSANFNLVEMRTRAQKGASKVALTATK